MKGCARCNKKSVLEQRLSLDKEFCDECLFDIDEEIRECWSSNRVSSVCQMVTGDGQHDTSRTCVSGNVFILKIFLICRDKKWDSGVVKTPAGAEGYSGGLLFRFRCRINSQINVTTGAEGVGFTGQPLRIQCHGMLMAGIQFTTGEH